jgi:protein-disulfide isomerase
VGKPTAEPHKVVASSTAIRGLRLPFCYNGRRRITNLHGGGVVSRRILHPDVGPTDHVRGRADAPVTLVEYGDYQCQQCGRAHYIVDIVLGELGDNVRYVFRNFPDSSVHPDAQMAAEAAESVAARAGEDAFWAMHDMLMENQDALSVDDLLAYAEAAGADSAAVAEDLSSGAARARVSDDRLSGERSGVPDTPTFFVNGVRFEGDWNDPDAFTLALDEAARATDGDRYIH